MFSIFAWKLMAFSLVRLCGRLRRMLSEQSQANMCREKIVEILQEVQARAEVALCFVGIKHWLYNIYTQGTEICSGYILYSESTIW